MEQGRHAERLAEERLLQEPGVRVLERNFRCKAGEIDLICEEEREGKVELVFVEVRFRASSSWVGALESVGPQKRQRLRRAIDRYLSRYRGRARGARLDVLCWDGKSWERIRNCW